MNVDLHKSAGVNHARLTIDIDGLGHTIVFKSGGVTHSPVNYTATAAGGYTAEGLYEPWQVEGEVTISKDMARWLLQAYQNRKSAHKTSAVYEIYSTIDRAVLKHQFNNVTVSKIPAFSLDSLGGEVSMQIGFSLNDYVETEIIDA